MVQSTSTPTISRADVGLRSARGPILLAVMLSVGLVAIDSTILATAVPAIVNDLGGFAQFPWLFSIYLLAQAVTVPIFAKFTDLVGRKPVMLLGIGLFVLGSVLSGFAWSMPALIVFRAIQGFGAGAVQPTAMTIIGDIYSLAERAKVQGYVASVWAISSVVGPTLGGVFVDFVDWRFIFFVNVPLGAVAAWVLARRFSEQVERAPHRVDYPGAGLLAIGTSLVVLGLLEGGVIWSWLSAPSVAVLLGGVVALVAFAFVERRASEPVIPPWVFRSRLLNTTNVTSLSVGVVLIGLTSYIPLYVQGVLHTNALVAGFALAALTLGWPIAASQAGRIYLKYGFRTTALLGTTIVLIGMGLLLLLAPSTSVWQVAGTCFVVGLGMGLVASPTLIAAQSAAEWNVRGVVTGTNMFARSMGSAVGIAVFGAIANAALASRSGGKVSATASAIPADVLHPALHEVFLGAAAVAVLMLLAVTLMPRRGVPQDTTAGSATAE
ncbi:MDR family MFS transporter [uncultured Friedmanniella sp.]|uniref:MDR family MFS transporter n=1 Tax=uncultured Friedmanniella sp. TaxID=335381 RepID=UPI0035C983C4